MSLELHPKCISKLVDGIAGILDKIIVNNKFFLNWKSCYAIFDVEEVLPKTGIIREKLERYISETPLYDFLFGLISLELYKSQKYDYNAKPSKLTELKEYSDTSFTSKRFVSELESLPWEYCVTFELGKSVESIFKNENVECQLSESMKIVKPDENFLKEFPLQLSKEKEEPSFFMMQLLMLRPKDWKSETAYLQFFIDGFIGDSITTNPLEEIVSLLKSFCGISIALRLFRVKHSYKSATPKLNLIIHRKVQGKWIVESFHELDEEFAGTFIDIEINDLSGVLDTSERKEAWVAECVARIRKIFRNEDKANKIILAGRWFFESFCGANQLLSFIQIIVALEILLGDKAVSDIMGLGELLRNRCAYLIGKSQEEREEILEEFKKIYDLRSKIVHRGKCRLTLKEKLLFNKLQWICQRVIQEEVRLISEEKNK